MLARGTWWNSWQTFGNFTLDRKYTLMSPVTNANTTSNAGH